MQLFALLLHLVLTCHHLHDYDGIVCAGIALFAVMWYYFYYSCITCDIIALFVILALFVLLLQNLYY